MKASVVFRSIAFGNDKCRRRNIGLAFVLTKEVVAQRESAVQMVEGLPRYSSFSSDG